MWISGYAMKSLVTDVSPMEELLFSLHISSGVTLALLLIVRILIRYHSRSTGLLPAPLKSLSRWENHSLSRWEIKASHLGHFALYALPAAAIVIGWAETDFGGHGVEWFGIQMPKLFPTLETLWGLNLEETTSELHELLAYSMLVVALIHIAAVIKHRWLDQQDVLYRMSFGRSESESHQ